MGPDNSSLRVVCTRACEFASLLGFSPQDLEPYTKYHPFDFEDCLR